MNTNESPSSKEQLQEKLIRLQTFGCNYTRHVNTMIDLLEKDFTEEELVELDRLLRYSGPCLEQIAFAMQSIVRKLKDAEAELMVM